MFSQTAKQSLTRRGSKLLVEMIIGVIGILGIMLAQVEVNQSRIDNQVLDSGEQVIGDTVSKVTAQIDWAELLF